MQNKKIKRFQVQPGYGRIMAGLFLVLIQATSVWASNSAINKLNFSSLSGDKVQIQLGLNGPAVTPKIFQTDNPSRIALDFSGVQSDLDQKMFTINQGAVNTVYVVEVAGRTRVIINLSETVPYTTRVEDNNVYVVLKTKNSIDSVKASGHEKSVDPQVTNLLPEQTIKNIDFRRGPKGEGRLLLALSTENTVVDVKERGGKVVLNFLNTKLPAGLEKSFDVSDFATPVQKIEAKRRGAGATITVTPLTGNYDYSSYQSEGLLTVDFIPLTAGEKEALLKKKFPYAGNKLSLNFQDIEVRSVLQILADFTDINIIAADTVGGAVTLRLNDVPWDQALDLILKSKGLAKRQTGNVILVAPTAEIIKIEEEELAAQRVIEQLEPLRTEYIQINYAKAEDFQVMLMSEGEGASTRTSGGNAGLEDDSFRLISPRGTAIVDERTNTLIVKDTAKQLVEIHKLIELLDVPVRQVLIESRIVIAETGFALDLGVKFGIAETSDLGGNKEFGFTGVGADNPGDTSNILSDLGAALAASGPGALTMTLARGADYALNLEINALQDDTNTELLSNPRVMTSDRVQATIKQGVQIPYQTQSQDGPVTELVDAVLELEVTPQITPSGSVIMELNIKKDAPGAVLATGGELTVPIDTREVNTTVQVENGETVVLGGIYEGEYSEVISTVPWFSDLPGIGWMFKQTLTSNTKRELLIFVTPKIVKNTLSSR
ncbi:MAG: type IV pilus secretin PilQ [Methylococcales bacterium]|nr:type IV pilus secretin PilQ [Methylococcales bacterium]